MPPSTNNQNEASELRFVLHELSLCSIMSDNNGFGCSS
jgi:hypothetical protein